MLDFLRIGKRTTKKNRIEIYPKFVIKKSKDLMIRGSDFYAIWDEANNIWSRDEQDAVRLIDAEVEKVYETVTPPEGTTVVALYLWDASSGMIDTFHKYCQKQMRDNYHELDETIIFSNTEVKKSDYASHKLTYPLEAGDYSAWDELVGTLYSDEERHKIEWAIGAVVTGESKKIQKFLVFYGDAGTGKSTVLNVIQKLFDGYYSIFDAKALGTANNIFALEAFKTNPLVAIQHDSDLSRIQDNTRLNSLTSHEEMTVNEKFKSTYTSRFNAFLFMGTNKPVKITDAKSGLIRRLIDITPTGKKLPYKKYKSLMKKINFELGAIASHCKDVFESDPDIYNTYVPTNMLSASNDFYNFVMDTYYVFEKEDGITLKAAWDLYKSYCDDARVTYPMPKRIFKEELKNYFWHYEDRHNLDGMRVRNYYYDFRKDKFKDDVIPVKDVDKASWIELKEQPSIFDKVYADAPAQYTNDEGTPRKKWANVKTHLSKLDTRKLHYVKVPENHIVIDFDVKDESGNKSLEKNIVLANAWPKTYAEVSKSGGGLHLHYIYSGDPLKLSRIYDDNIEIKVFTGNSSLRRKLSKCNDLEIATISSGLPLREDNKKMVNFDSIKSEKHLRTLIKKALNKEIHANTKPNIDFIAHILDEAYKSGMHYDVEDLRGPIISYAASSTHQSQYCMKIAGQMQFCSEDVNEEKENESNEPIVFFDVEVFPNFFLICWKRAGEENKVNRMYNPSPEEVEQLLTFKLVGFNNRRYDNHILYSRTLGSTNEQLYKLSQNIILNHTGFHREAYNLSYTDIYDFSKKKQSLKKWEIELGINHKELGLSFDEPVTKDQWEEIAKYCDNDVLATEAVFNHLHGDFLAREILATIAGMTVNTTTNTLTTRIIFGNERNPGLVYTDLATGLQYYPGEDVTESKGHPSPEKVINAFPGYSFDLSDEDHKYHNMYRDEDVGFGGYVYANPGMYGRAVTFDVASMHPNSLIQLNLFGKYTDRFKELMDARLAIKHKDYDTAKKLFDGKLTPYLTNPDDAKALSGALKIAINSVYGLTSAKFDNPFKDERNVNNIVALRGALFMVNLKHEVQDRGFKVIHIKTDSIKIADPTPEIEKMVIIYGLRYGYTFEVEHTWEKLCLVNNAVYIGKHGADDEDDPGEWEAVGAQFQQPYVFKKLFSKQPIEFKDLCETKSVTTAIYLDMNENLPEDEHNYIFVGRVGQFSPIKEGCGGGRLMRISKDGDKYGAVTGAKDYRWMESSVVKELGKEKDIDKSYYNKLVDDAVENISQYGDFEWFVS